MEGEGLAGDDSQLLESTIACGLAFVASWEHLSSCCMHPNAGLGGPLGSFSRAAVRLLLARTAMELPNPEAVYLILPDAGGMGVAAALVPGLCGCLKAFGRPLCGTEVWSMWSLSLFQEGFSHGPSAAGQLLQLSPVLLRLPLNPDLGLHCDSKCCCFVQEQGCTNCSHFGCRPLSQGGVWQNEGAGCFF